MQKGFTIIEFMIIVAIIGILAAVAIPGYQEYKCKQTGINCPAPNRTAKQIQAEKSAMCVQGYTVITKSGQQLIGIDGKPVTCF